LVAYEQVSCRLADSRRPIVTGVLFPLWQIDRRDYDAICAYLEITPNAGCTSVCPDIWRKLPSATVALSGLPGTWPG
jgi:hypothetical protein